MKRCAFVLCVVLSISGALYAQGWSESGTKTVTNVDLEKFRKQRIAGEREYRRLYAELGFPSPEELEAQIERQKEEKFLLSERLRQERLEDERIDIERSRVVVEAYRAQGEIAAREEAARRESESSTSGNYGGYGWGYPGWGGYGGWGIYLPRQTPRYGRRPIYRSPRVSPYPRYNPWPRFSPLYPTGGSILIR